MRLSGALWGSLGQGAGTLFARRHRQRGHGHQGRAKSTGQHLENKQSGAEGREGPLAEGAKGNS